MASHSILMGKLMTQFGVMVLLSCGCMERTMERSSSILCETLWIIYGVTIDSFLSQDNGREVLLWREHWFGAVDDLGGWLWWASNWEAGKLTGKVWGLCHCSGLGLFHWSGLGLFHWCGLGWDPLVWFGVWSIALVGSLFHGSGWEWSMALAGMVSRSLAHIWKLVCLISQ